MYSILSKSNILFFVVAVSLGSFFPDASAQENDDQTLVKKSSYIIGFNMVQNILGQGVELNKEAFIQGITAALESEEFKMSDEEVEATMIAFQKYTERRMLEKMQREAEANRAEGEAFQAEFLNREGVQRLNNGVLYQVLSSGNGVSPTADDKVRIHYHGTFPNGKVFDSSVERNQPAEFPVGGVVEGFSSALQAMKVGDKWRVVIPSGLAYKEQAPPSIGPNRTLIFEIELLSILN